MKKILLSALALGAIANVSAQAPNANHKAYYTIPTVVHLVNATSGGWNPPTSGPLPISEAQVIAGLDLISKSLRGELGRTRLDEIMQSNRNKVAGLDIELKLVPNGYLQEQDDIRSANFNGNAANGTYNFKTYATAKNRDATRYFNIYLVNTAGNGGVAFRPDEAPGQPAASANFTQGMYLNFKAWPIGDLANGTDANSGQWMDNNGNGFKYFGLAAHEVGHYLNLIHAYGSQNVDSDCAAIALANDDSVADTPKTSEDCVNFDTDPTEVDNVNIATHHAFACDGVTRVMRDNAMTYSNHIVMFTPNQVTRMQNALNSAAASRNTLWTHANLVQVGLKAATDDRYCFAKGRVNGAVANLREWISNVSLTPTAGGAAVLNNTTVAPANVNSYYSSFTNAPANVVRNQVYNLSVTVNNFWNAANSHTFIAAWIDWNNNGLFEDTERTILRNPNSDRDALSGIVGEPSIATATITVPVGATLGNKRMRVRSIYNDASQLEYLPATPPTLAGLERIDMVEDAAYSCTPCGDLLYGEVEDYTLNIQATLSTSEIEYNSKDLKVVAQNDLLSVAYTGDDNITKIEITDLAGQLQKQAQVANQSTTDISQLATGTYVVKVIGEKNAYSTKFIKK
jgi:GEVED domain/Pregnancy-associated plasma protein-A/Secretion system C-terminal sorting domain